MIRDALIALATATQLLGARNPSPRAAELERIILLRPTEARAYLELAAEYERYNDRDRAEATLRNGVERSSDARLARSGLVDFLMRAERWPDAVSVALPLATDSAGRNVVARLRVNAGIVAWRRGDRTQAIAQWRAALATDPALLEGAVDLAMGLLDGGKRDSARAVVNASLRYHPSDGRLLALRARTLSGSEGMQAAITALRQLRTERPDDEAIGLELANLQVSAGGNSRLAGMVLYDSLIKAPAASERAFTIVSELWLDSQQAKAAAEVAESGTLRYPRSGTLYALLAEAQAAKSPPDWREAATAYKRAIALVNPSASEPLALSLIDVYVATADTANVASTARDLSERPASPATLMATASRLLPLGAQARALADSIYAQLIERDSADAGALEARGALAEGDGDSAKALELYARAVALDSSGPEPPLGVLRLTKPAPSPDVAQRLLRQALWRGLSTVQGLELSSAAAASGPLNVRRVAKLQPAVNRRDATLASLRRALDTVVFHTSWGKAELVQLQLAYPRSTLLARYAADVAAAGQSDTEALASYERLLRRDPTSVELQLRRAEVLERTARVKEAADAYSRALDLEPENDSTFRKLQTLRQGNGTLEQLVSQLRRLRARLPQSHALADHEIEVLSRLGRYAEAQALAKKLAEEKKP